MSMLSAQCDKLRLYARQLRAIASDLQLVLRAADEMEDAADVIWRLRNQHFERCEELDEAREQIDHLRNVVESLWPRAAFTMSKTCKETWIAELGEMGIEVEDDEHSEY